MTQLGGAASLAAAILVSVATVIAQGPPVRGAWTDRVLTTLPPGIAPATHAWDSWIVLTPDLSRFAYAARFRSGRFVREAIVDGARWGPAFQYASRPVISPNGEHLVYISVPEQRGDDLPAFLEAGRWRVQIQVDRRVLGPTWIPVFSPDSRRIAFQAERPGGKFSIGIVDADVDPTALERSIAWGPEFIEIDKPVWSPDSTNVIYSGARNRDEWVVTLGTNPYATFRDATAARFSPNGIPVFIAFDGRKRFISVGDTRQPGFDKVTEPFFKEDGELVYGATDEGRHYIVTKGGQVRVAFPVEGVVVAAKGSRTTSWYREVEPGRQRMIINGLPVGRFYRRVSKPVIHAETGAYAYTAQDHSRFYVVTSRGESPAYEGVLWNPRLRDDGTAAGYVALDGNRLVWKVVPLQ